MVRELGPRAVTAFRHARVGLWRFKRNPEQRDRAAKYATFAFIGLFAVGSVDAIVTGGADFAPHSAYAAEYRPTIIAAAAPASAPAEIELPATEDAALKATEVDYSFTTETLLGAPEAEVLTAEGPAEPAPIEVESTKVDITKPGADATVGEEPAL